MKIKRYIEYFECKHSIGENVEYNPKKKIISWLNRMRIKNYVINDDLTVDVKGNVNLKDKDLTEIPIKFNTVNGYFSCATNLLTSLIGSPEIVDDFFSCTWNSLTTLIGGPKIVKHRYYCLNNQLENLNGLPVDFNLNKFEMDNTNSKHELIWKWLESILSNDESLITYHMDWIKNHIETMPSTFKNKFDYLLEFDHYTKTFEN